MMKYCQLDPYRNKTSVKFYRNSYIFIQENPFQNVVWKMAAILSRAQCVNNKMGLVHVMAYPQQVTSHYPNQWRSSQSLLGYNELTYCPRTKWTASTNAFSCDGLELIRLHAITRTNDGPVHWHPEILTKKAFLSLQTIISNTFSQNKTDVPCFG